MDRAPLSRPLAPVWLVTGVLERTHWRLVSARFPDVHAYAQLPGSPDTYELPFRTPKRTSRLPWTPASGTVPFHQLLPLRSLIPPASPFANDPSYPVPPADTLLDLSPLKSSPYTPGILGPARTRRLEPPTGSRRLRQSDAKDLAAPRAGWDLRTTQVQNVDPVGGFRSSVDRPEPSFDGYSPPMAFSDERTRRRDLRSLSVHAERLSSAEVPTPLRSPASSSTS